MFTWRELMTKDVAKAKGFYGELFGWTFADSEMGDFVYTLIHDGKTEIGGMMPMMNDEHPPHWMGYVSVADVDAACAAAKKAGGTVAVEPMDIPPGRFAVIGDPSGAYFSVSRWAEGDPEPGRADADSRLDEGLRPDVDLGLDEVTLAELRSIGAFAGAELPPAVVVDGLRAWGEVFGLLSLELFGHFANVITDMDAFFDSALERSGRAIGAR